MKKIKLFYLLLILTLVSCSHFTKYTFVDAALKKDFDFKAGSYWIMKDSASGRVDSFYVTDHIVVHAVEHTYWDYYDGEEITIRIVQKSLSPGYDLDSFMYKLYMWKSGMLISYLHPYAISVRGVYSAYGNRIEYYPAFYYPYSTMQPVTYHSYMSNGHDTVSIGQLDYSMTPAPVKASYSVNGHNFTDVTGINYNYRIKYDTAEAYNYNDDFSFSSAAGLVQIRQYHPQDSMDHNWQLQRWHVVK